MTSGDRAKKPLGISGQREHVMFTAADIRHIAIQIEKNGEETYLKASKAAEDRHISEILEWMAREEARHVKWFEKLNATLTITAEQQKIEAMGKNLLQDMIKGNSFLLDENELGNAKTIDTIISRSIELEHDTILFYEFLLGFIEDEETIEQLKKIITEEYSHIDQLQLLRRDKHTLPLQP